MKFFTIAALFAATAIAMPHEPSSTNIDQTQNICGGAQLSCCQEIDQTAAVSKDEKEQILDLLGAGLLNDGAVGKYRGCTSLVSALQASVSQCNNHAACCNGATSNNNGLVNVAIPCVPINVL